MKWFFLVPFRGESVSGQFLVDLLQAVALMILAIGWVMTNWRLNRALKKRLMHSASNVMDPHERWRREGNLIFEGSVGRMPIGRPSTRRLS
jgi:hypothetical protein